MIFRGEGLSTLETAAIDTSLSVAPQEASSGTPPVADVAPQAVPPSGSSIEVLLKDNPWGTLVIGIVIGMIVNRK